MVTLSPDEPAIGPGCRIENSRIGCYVSLAEGTRLINTRFGDYSYTDRFCDIANADIGKFANIASYARIGPTDHPLDRASLHHFMYRSADYWEDAEDDAGFFARRATRLTAIGHDTWVGHNAIVKPELTIGHGAVIAMGSVVTRDVAPYAIVAGNPARHVRDRQPPEIAARLIRLAWWDWDHACLRTALEDFRRLTAEAFLDKYEQGLG